VNKKKYKTTIVWGTMAMSAYMTDGIPGLDEHEKEEGSRDVRSYGFNSLKEYVSFMAGVDEAIGWLEYAKMEDEDAKSERKRRKSA